MKKEKLILCAIFTFMFAGNARAFESSDHCINYDNPTRVHSYSGRFEEGDSYQTFAAGKLVEDLSQRKQSEYSTGIEVVLTPSPGPYHVPSFFEGAKLKKIVVSIPSFFNCIDDYLGPRYYAVKAKVKVEYEKDGINKSVSNINDLVCSFNKDTFEVRCVAEIRENDLFDIQLQSN